MSNGDQFLGHWKLDGSENWDDFMKAAGIGFVTRKVGNSITSYEEWKREGDQWSLNITSTFKSKLLTFKMDVEFEEETMDGRKVKSVLTLEGDKLVHRQTATKEGELDSTITREIVDGKIVATFVADNKGGLTAKRIFAPYKP